MENENKIVLNVINYKREEIELEIRVKDVTPFKFSQKINAVVGKIGVNDGFKLSLETAKHTWKDLIDTSFLNDTGIEESLPIMDKIEEYFVNDPMAIDLINQELVNFLMPPIKRNVNRIKK